MPANDSRDRIRTSIWKAIARSEIDLTALPSEEVDRLVDLVTGAAILEMDEYMDHQTEKDQDAAEHFYPMGDDDQEKVLWKGRPLLSISEHYVITNERVRIVRGLLGKDREDIELIRIQDIDHSQSLPERAVNVGDITIRSHDSSHPSIVLNNVRNVQEVHEILRRAVLNARKQYKITFQEEM
jgi:membrane protein YdbS with pleckstrin-like domain